MRSEEDLEDEAANAKDAPARRVTTFEKKGITE